MKQIDIVINCSVRFCLPLETYRTYIYPVLVSLRFVLQFIIRMSSTSANKKKNTIKP
jgi:hypothetical protein